MRSIIIHNISPSIYKNYIRLPQILHTHNILDSLMPESNRLFQLVVEVVVDNCLRCQKRHSKIDKKYNIINYYHTNSANLYQYRVKACMQCFTFHQERKSPWLKDYIDAQTFLSDETEILKDLYRNKKYSITLIE